MLYTRRLKKKNIFGKQIGGSLIDTLTDHAKENFVFLLTHFKKRKKMPTAHFSTFTCSHKQRRTNASKRAKILLPTLLLLICFQI